MDNIEYYSIFLVLIIIPYVLDLSYIEYIILVCIVTINIIVLVFLLQDDYLVTYYMDNVFLGFYTGCIYNTISECIINTIIPNEYVALLMFIGIAMININLMFNENPIKMTLLDRLIYL